MTSGSRSCRGCWRDWRGRRPLWHTHVSCATSRRRRPRAIDRRAQFTSSGTDPLLWSSMGSGLRAHGHDNRTKHIFVTGGVASSLGKGLTASSLGRLLRSRGLTVTMQKLDPYLNVDPGTMNPFQHGEVFVTDDGAETDLDIGHYER